MKKVYPIRLEESMIKQVQDLAIVNDRSANSEFRRLITKGLESSIDTTLDSKVLLQIKEIADKNGYTFTSVKDTLAFGLNILSNCIEYLDEESFSQITSYNK
jgi:hypothetical protein